MSPTFRSFVSRNYRFFFVGALVNNVGTWMGRTAQSWLVLTELTDHDPAALGIVTAEDDDDGHAITAAPVPPPAPTGAPQPGRHSGAPIRAAQHRLLEARITALGLARAGPGGEQTASSAPPRGQRARDQQRSKHR